MNKYYPNTKEIQIAIIAIVGMMTIITGFSYQFDAENERLEAQKIRAKKRKIGRMLFIQFFSQTAN